MVPLVREKLSATRATTRALEGKRRKVGKAPTLGRAGQGRGQSAYSPNFAGCASGTRLGKRERGQRKDPLNYRTMVI